MGKRVNIENDGINSAGIDDSLKPYDIQCPYMQAEGRTGNNYWKSHCMERLKMHENDDICGRCLLIGQKPKDTFQKTIKRLMVSPYEAARLGAVWLEMYKKGMTIKDISNKVYCSQSAVRTYMVLAGYQPKQRPSAHKL